MAAGNRACKRVDSARRRGRPEHYRKWRRKKMGKPEEEGEEKEGKT